MSRAIRRIVILAVFALLVAIQPASAARADAPRQTASPIDMETRVGFDGYVQSGAFVPINVTLANDGADVSGEVRVLTEAFSGTSAVYTRSVDLPRGSRKLVSLYMADTSTFSSTVTVDLLDERGRVIQSDTVRVQTVMPTTLLIGLWSGSPNGIADIQLVEPSSQETEVATLTVDDLPGEAKGWEALDVLVVSDVDTGQMSSAQQAALHGWLVGGGRLIVIGGVGHLRTLSGLMDITPVQAQSTEDMPVDALAAYAGIDVPVEAAPVAVGPLTDDAHVLVSQDGVPLIVWRPVGYGRVDFFAPDPNLAPLANIASLENLWRAILLDGTTRPSWGYGFTEQWDYARGAVAAVPGVSLPSTLVLCGFLGLYILLIGPVNFIVLTRLKRRELAWFTIPALIILFSAVAYVTGFQLRGSRAILHRLAVVESWQGEDTAQIDGLLGVWSPRRARYDIALEEGLLARPLPQNFGGGLVSGGRVTISQLERTTLQDISVDIGSVVPFTVEGYTDGAPNITGELGLETDTDGIHLVGRIDNASLLMLQDASLVLGGAAVPLGQLDPGTSVEVDEVLEGGMTVRAPASSLDPYPGDNYGYYYGGTSDTFLSDVTGEDCYAWVYNERRCALLLSVFTGGQTYGTEVALFGWVDAVPFDTTVLNSGSENIDLALYIVQLDVSYDAADRQDAIVVPPGLMQWRPITSEQTYDYSTPYNLYMYPDQSYSFRFEPGPLVPDFSVTSLAINLQTQYENDERPAVRIYNYEERRWDRVDMEGEELTLTDVDSYVDESNGVQVRLVGAQDGFGVQISRFDVTLYGTVASEDGE